MATSYAGLVRRYLAEHGVSASVVRLDGAVETAVQLGVADVIADVVETGTTLRAAGLEVFGEPILRSEAVLVRRSGAGEDPAVDVLIRRLQGVLVARQYVVMDYDVRVELVEKACAITPGLESPTISPLRDTGLGRGAGDGPRGSDQPGDGRPLDARRPGHSRDRDTRLSALSPRATSRGGLGFLSSLFLLQLGLDRGGDAGGGDVLDLLAVDDDRRGSGRRELLTELLCRRGDPLLEPETGDVLLE